jgi:hypothetical protein
MIVNGWVQSDVIKKVHDKRIKALRAEANGKKAGLGGVKTRPC